MQRSFIAHATALLKYPAYPVMTDESCPSDCALERFRWLTSTTKPEYCGSSAGAVTCFLSFSAKLASRTKLLPLSLPCFPLQYPMLWFSCTIFTILSIKTTVGTDQIGLDLTTYRPLAEISRSPACTLSDVLIHVASWCACACSWHVMKKLC